MPSFLSSLLEPSAFTPHGFCLLWDPGLIWLQGLSDVVIGLSYFSIPLVLFQFARRRTDLEYRWVLVLFALFIVACGTTHFMSVLTLWVPLYWLEGAVKLATAIVSVVTAVLLWPLLPKLLALPSPAALRLANEQLTFQIEEGRRTQAALHEGEELVRHLQKMEALGNLAAGIAHDFNNILQAVGGGLRLIKRRAGDAEAVQQVADMVTEATTRGASITGRLLAFSRKGGLQAAPVAPDELLAGLREMLAPTLGPDITLRVSSEANIPPLWADAAQVQTMLVNLALNARDAMPEGGVLTISATHEPVSNPAPNASGLTAGDFVRLDIADTGQGMDAATLSRAGEPFFTTKPVGQGTGLGLAMVRSFTHQSGGGFAIESAPRHGTHVTLWLPVAPTQDAAPNAAPEKAHAVSSCQASPDAPAAAPSEAPSEAPSKARILLVDDDKIVRDMLACELVDRGYQVTDISDGRGALALIDEHQEFDAVITDLSMPGMNGVALIGELRHRLPSLPVILLTGFVDSEALVGLKDARDPHLVIARKPMPADALAERLEALLAPAGGGQVTLGAGR